MTDQDQLRKQKEKENRAKQYLAEFAGVFPILQRFAMERLDEHKKRLLYVTKKGEMREAQGQALEAQYLLNLENTLRREANL